MKDMIAPFDRLRYGGAVAETGARKPQTDYDFVAVVTDAGDGYIDVEMRNRFAVGDVLEALSPSLPTDAHFTVTDITGADGAVAVADKVQAKLRLSCPLRLGRSDILRRKRALRG